MKRTMTILAALLFCTGATMADEVSVTNVTIPQGGTALVSISLVNPATQYSAAQFQLRLPDGVSSMLDATDSPIVTPGERFAGTNHGFGTSHSPEDGTDQLTIFSINSSVIPGTEGVLLSVMLHADETLSVGDVLEGRLENIEISKVDATPTLFNDQTFTITIGEPVDPWIILDEDATTAPNGSSEEVDIVVKRTIKANVWSTLCLPFDMTETQVKTAFGDDVQLAEFTSYEAEYDADDNVTGISVEFTDTDLSEGFYGNYPYLIKTSKDITEFEVTSTIDPDEENTVAEYDNGKKGKQREIYGSFIGTYHAGTTVPENSLFLNDNAFWYSTGQTQMKAFRAYFKLDDVIPRTSSARQNVRLSFAGDGSTTKMSDIRQTTLGDGYYYNLQGQRVTVPVRGIFIKNGKKEIVK